MQPQTARAPAEKSAHPLIQQFVNFRFFAVDPAWRRLPAAEKERARGQFQEVVDRHGQRMIIMSYSLVGIRAEAHFMLWRISESIEAFQEMSGEVNRTLLGAYLTNPYTYLSMTKRSTYVREHEHEGGESSRLRITPGKSKYLFVYPFLKTRAWYALPMERRQQMMDAHIAVGHKYPSIKIHTTYSFGLDDQEFVLAFEGDRPSDFLDLVMELRGSEASQYTLRDTPTFTCVRQDLSEILNQLG